MQRLGWFAAGCVTGAVFTAIIGVAALVAFMSLPSAAPSVTPPLLHMMLPTAEHTVIILPITIKPTATTVRLCEGYYFGGTRRPLNVREHPDMLADVLFQIVAQLDEDVPEVDVIGHRAADDGYTWVQIVHRAFKRDGTFTETGGWVRGDLLSMPYCTFAVVTPEK